MKKPKTNRKRGVIRPPILQEEAEWLQYEYINRSMINRIFENEMKKINPERKRFDFYQKQNPKSNRIFKKMELLVLEHIKMRVQESLHIGSVKYLFLTKFIELFVIPEIKKINKKKKRYEYKLKFDKLETLISAYNSGTTNEIFNNAVGNAKNELKKVAL